MELALGIIGGVLVTAALAAGFWRYSRTGASQVADDLASTRLSLTEAETQLRSETERSDTLAHERDDAREQARLHAEELAQTRLARTEAETRLKSETERADTLTRERDAAREQVSLREGELAQAQAEVARLTADRQARMEEIEKARAELDTHFKGIAAEVVRANSEEFQKQAQERARHEKEAVQSLVKPVGESLDKLQKRIGEIEEKRSGAYEGINKLVAETKEQMGSLRAETSHLASALCSPQIRGRWGEQLLENIFELAGMREHVHYHRQVTLETGDGQSRPDFIVTVPGGMKIVIDSKTPLDNYYRAHETEDEDEQSELLRKHAQSLADHARDLGRKDYSRTVEGGLGMVVLFVPADPILDAAMQARTSVWDAAWRDHRVLIATPSVVIALLCTIHAAWQREDVQRNAEAIASEARELYHRLGIYADHISKLRRGLRQAVTAYNDSVGSFGHHLLVQARKLEDLHAVRESDRFDVPQPLDEEFRRLEGPEEDEEQLTQRLL